MRPPRHASHLFPYALFLALAWLMAPLVADTSPSLHSLDQAWHQQILSRASLRQRALQETLILAGNASSSTWNTSDGSAPLIIANGGSSGIFPDQTQLAYGRAAVTSLLGSALFCDLQLTNDSVGLCRTGIDLGKSTNINQSLPNLTNQYSVNGDIIQGFFSIDLTQEDIPNIQATQSNAARPPWYDGIFPVLQLENASTVAVQFDSPLWVNIEFYSFFKEHGLDMASYVITTLKSEPLMISYLSSPDIAFLKAIRAGAPKNLPKLIFRFHGKQELEPSTNATYGSLSSNFTETATFASGILVPKDYIWPVDSTTSYLGHQTTLIQDARAAGLAVYASDFINDEVNNVYVPIYNYSLDPIREYLQYLPATGPIVDGFLTDFPITASEAIACYKSTSPSTEPALKTKPLVISHNGASGDYPGCTLLAYKGAVEAGTSYIDCPVQFTQDGVPICRESPNLVPNTDIALHTSFYPKRLTTIPELQSTAGIFTFNMTWAEINTLKARMFSPAQASYNVSRNPAFTQETIMTLSDFLDYAKNLTNVGIFINIQNGYFLDSQVNLDVLGPVVSALNAAGLQKSDRVLIQSEDSAVLQRLKQLTPYQLVYRVTNETVSITQTDVSAIKALAPVVTLPRGLVEESIQGFLLNATTVVSLFQKNNMTVLVSYLRNEFTSLAFDYEADPTLELNTLVQILGVDGVITDFPATARAYLNNACLKLKGEPAVLNYSIFPVTPGELLYNIPTNLGAPPSTDPVYGAENVTENEQALPPTVISPVSSRLPPGTGSSPSPSSPPLASAPSPSPSMGSPSSTIPGLLLLLLTSFSLFAHGCLGQ